MSGIACLLLILAVHTPSVLGHSERPYLADDQGSGYVPGIGVLNGVSGRYIGSAGAAVAVEAYNNPQGTIVPLNASRWCDMEVFVDSNSYDYAGVYLNEQRIDGTSTYTGIVVDTWDDGGPGGACHTGHYTTPGFNTFGCQPGSQVSGGTHAGTDIWVGALCDWKAVWQAPSSSELFVQCLWSQAFRPFHPLVLLSPNFDDTNAVVEGYILDEGWQPSPGLDLPAFQSELDPFADCSQEFADCLFNPTCVADSVEICGTDGTPDAINYGFAGVGSSITPAPFPLNYGGYIVNGDPPVAFACPPPGDVAAIYIFDTVATIGGGVNDPGTVDVYPALTGEVFSIPSTSPGWWPSICTEAAATNPIVFQFGCWQYYYYNNSACTAWASVWNPVTSTRENTCEPS